MIYHISNGELTKRKNSSQTGATVRLKAMGHTSALLIWVASCRCWTCCRVSVVILSCSSAFFNVRSSTSFSRDLRCWASRRFDSSSFNSRRFRSTVALSRTHRHQHYIYRTTLRSYRRKDPCKTLWARARVCFSFFFYIFFCFWLRVLD